MPLAVFSFSEYTPKTLASLDLSHTPLTAFGFSEYTPGDLQTLNLNSTKITEFVFNEFSPHGLISLSLHGTPLTSFDFSDHVPESLQELELSFTRLRHFETTDRLRNLKKLRLVKVPLRSFQLSNNVPLDIEIEIEFGFTTDLARSIAADRYQLNEDERPI